MGPLTRNIWFKKRWSVPNVYSRADNHQQIMHLALPCIVRRYEQSALKNEPFNEPVNFFPVFPCDCNSNMTQIAIRPKKKNGANLVSKSSPAWLSSPADIDWCLRVIYVSGWFSVYQAICISAVMPSSPADIIGGVLSGDIEMISGDIYIYIYDKLYRRLPWDMVGR